MRIANNITAIFANNRLDAINKKRDKHQEKLSSGYRINRASDDAAGLAISEKMRAQIGGLRVARRNAWDGISLVQTAEGALNEQHAILQRMRELTVQAANDTNKSEDRQKIGLEISKLIDELDSIVINTEYNSKKLFLGLDAEPIIFQVGANSGQTLELRIEKSMIPSFGYFAWEAGHLLIGGPGADQIVDLSSYEKASDFISIVDKAINDVSDERSNLGAMQNRLEHALANIETTIENTAAAESRIRDADMASIMVELTKSQIIQQASTAMLVHANQKPQSILELL